MDGVWRWAYLISLVLSFFFQYKDRLYPSRGQPSRHWTKLEKKQAEQEVDVPNDQSGVDDGDYEAMLPMHRSALLKMIQVCMY